MTALLPPERPGHAPPADLLPAREGLSAAVARGAWLTNPPPVEDWIDGLRGLRWRPGGEPVGTVVHFHGGGYRLGAPEMEGPFAQRLALACGVEVIVPQYGLAPERPFPGALHDGMKLVRALAGAGPLFLSGGSAGGGLAAALAGPARGAGIALAGMLLHSPWLDLTITADSYAANADSDALFSRASAEAAAGLYLQGHDPRDPLASPLFADPADFPPLLVTVGSGEVLLDDARAFAARLGPGARLLVAEGMEHVAVTRAMDATGAGEVFAASADFIRARLADHS
ncbi:alpha/beta hydrolase fold domain-containing protein [Novosphingobium sp. TH158]|uniref:alpha/beta hydrolase fold domain-containing protein n=1 Tax=Novosphingobium sp. TH158 TaxID=2067455 RepID=UPI000C7C68DB|nr:alpha/beta hydrolase fold domain-containing protein [Novosphingobium sp. TH158]PLK27009.1 hypothetical protein C0V78_09025 [Novosphingobium sp. TH158]